MTDPRYTLDVPLIINERVPMPEFLQSQKWTSNEPPLWDTIRPMLWLLLIILAVDAVYELAGRIF